mgnify:CR=1 FL=1
MRVVLEGQYGILVSNLLFSPNQIAVCFENLNFCFRKTGNIPVNGNVTILRCLSELDYTLSCLQYTYSASAPLNREDTAWCTLTITVTPKICLTNTRRREGAFHCRMCPIYYCTRLHYVWRVKKVCATMVQF